MAKLTDFFEVSMTAKIIFVNVLIFVLALIIMLFAPNAIDYLALKPADFLHGKNVWTLITSVFMHSGAMHLIFNMFSLWFIGRFVEKIIGRKRFLRFYLASGIIAGLVFIFAAGFLGSFGGVMEKIFGNPEIAGVGASGAIFGLLGLLAVLTPRSRVYLIAGPLIAIIFEAIFGSVFKNSALTTMVSLLVSVYIFISIFSIFSFNPRKTRIALPLEMPFWLLPIIAIVPLTVIGIFVSLPIGNTAHFGGLVTGLAYGWYLRVKYRRKVKMLGRALG